MKNTSKIVRSTNTTKHNFTPISNNLIQNENLSLEAIGLVCFIVSLPESWIIYKQQIQSALKMNRTKFDRIWKECVNAGYIKCRKVRTNNGQFTYHYEVSDNLSVVGLSTGGLSNDGLTTDGKPYSKEKKKKEKIQEEKIHLEKIYQESNSSSNTVTQPPRFLEIFNSGGDAREYLNNY